MEKAEFLQRISDALENEKEIRIVKVKYENGEVMKFDFEELKVEVQIDAEDDEEDEQEDEQENEQENEQDDDDDDDEDEEDEEDDDEDDNDGNDSQVNQVSVGPGSQNIQGRKVNVINR